MHTADGIYLLVLLFVFWYCHKRGKEVRLEREKSEKDALAGEIVKDGEPSGTTPAATATAPAVPGSGDETQPEHPT